MNEGNEMSQFVCQRHGVNESTEALHELDVDRYGLRNAELKEPRHLDKDRNKGKGL